jgi:response regulator of citrate/malate metabolism
MNSIIYVVDDDEFFAELMKRKLLKHGFTQVYTINSGAEFIDELNVKPDLIFLDYDLGDLTGIQVLLKIKKYSPSTEVIMISSQEKQKIIDDAKSLGVSSYITKGKPNMNLQIEEALKSYESKN